MFYALSWFAVMGLLALWSFAVWAFYAAGAWAVSNAGVLAGSSGPVEAWRVPAWLAPWIPPELAPAFASMLSALTPAMSAMLDWAPALGGGLSVLVWVVWAAGAVLLILLGMVLSAMIAMLRRRGRARMNPSRAEMAT